MPSERLPAVLTGPRPGPSSLLSLPPEIRLQIYSFLLRISPLPRARDLASGYPGPPPPGVRVYSHLAVVDDDDDRNKALLSAHRPHSYIPTSLLVVCRQIYCESRLIPFQQNEFVFETFFASGLVAAGVFVRRLAEWQRKEVRFVRLEVQARDLGLQDQDGQDAGSRKKSTNKCEVDGDMAGLNKWIDICQGLEGMKGLRLRVDCMGSRNGLGEDEERWRWVDEGLKRVEGLRWFEVEIVRGGWWEEERKVEWCKGVEERLNTGGMGEGERRVRVVAVRGRIGTRNVT